MVPTMDFQPGTLGIGGFGGGAELLWTQWWK